MANTALSNPAAALGEAARFGEIRGRLLFLIGALVVYRIGAFIPVPGINPSEVARFFTDQSNTILGIVNMFSGGALSRFSISSGLPTRRITLRRRARSRNGPRWMDAPMRLRWRRTGRASTCATRTRVAKAAARSPIALLTVWITPGPS